MSRFARLLIVLTSAVLWFCVLTAAGLAALIAGVYVLAGFGWMLIAGGVSLLAVAWFLRLGIAHA
jgi:hypothetical protein